MITGMVYQIPQSLDYRLLITYTTGESLSYYYSSLKAALDQYDRTKTDNAIADAILYAATWHHLTGIWKGQDFLDEALDTVETGEGRDDA